MTSTYISFIVPVFNEVDNVVELHGEIVAVVKKIGKPFEIIFVDDGSRDGTAEKLTTLSPITVITFRKNFGQTAALDAGIKHARGDYLVTLDGDGQNDPADIPQLLQKLQKEQLDVVCGWRKDRHDPASKRFISKGAQWLRSILVRDNVQDAGCTLRVYKRECFEQINLRGEMHRFIPALLGWQGFKIGEIPVNHRSRKKGQSKYNSRRMLKGFLDMMSLWFFRKFASRPLHFLGTLGLVFFVLGLVIGSISIIARMIYSVGLADKIWPLASVFLMLFGMQMFVSGLIMDLIISTHNQAQYMIRDISNRD